MEEAHEEGQLHVDDIPTEVMMHIFSFVYPVGVLRSESVSHRWRDIVTSDLVWKAVHMRWFGGKRAKHKETITWKVHCLRSLRSYLQNTRDNTPYDTLGWACACGHHVVLAKILREHNFSLDDLNGKPGGLPPLHRCIISGSARCAEVLALAGANVNVTDPRGQVPIGLAAQRGMLDIVEVLLRYGGGGSDFAKLLDDQKKVTGKRQRHTKPLFHQAAYGGHLTIAKILLDRAKTDGQDVKKMVDAQDAKGFTPLHYAALGGRDAMIEYLLSQGADIDARTNKQQGRKTALLIAAAERHIKTMETLLERGALMDPPLPPDDGAKLTPHQQKRLEENLLYRGHTQGAQQAVFTPFHQTCSDNSIEGAKLFLDRGVDPNLMHMNRSPLQYAVVRHNPVLPFFEFLLKRGADINFQAPGGGLSNPPIYELLSAGLSPERIPLLHFLLDNGAKLDLPNTASHPLVSLMWNQLQSEDLVIENAKILIAHGAKMDSHEILYFAAERYSTRVLEFLLDQEGAQINPPNQTSPFASAMFQYSMVVSSIWRDKTVEVPRLRANVDFLLSRGADRNHIVGGTPWWHGNFNTSQIEGLRYVLELGVDVDWLPSIPPIEPFYWDDLRNFYLYIDFLAEESGDYTKIQAFMMLLAEHGVNLGWTNENGENILQYTKAHPELFNQRDVTKMPEWLAVLEEAVALSQVNREKKKATVPVDQNEKEEDKKGEKEQGKDK